MNIPETPSEYPYCANQRCGHRQATMTAILAPAFPPFTRDHGAVRHQQRNRRIRRLRNKMKQDS